MRGSPGRRLAWRAVALAATLPVPALAALAPTAAAAPPVGAPASLAVRVRHDGAPVPGAFVLAGVDGEVTDSRGLARLSLGAGEYVVTVSRIGFAPDTLALRLAAGADTTILVHLSERSLEAQVVVVSAARTGTLAGDQPIRVLALPEDEIEENLTIAPGELSTLLNELPGVRVQASAPGLGGAGLRLRGFPARHTLLLMDGLPLLGPRAGGFGLLQSPALDVARVEVIQGGASSLYGGAALGGVVNLVSRPPGSEPELLVSRSSRGGTDVVGFLSGRSKANAPGGAASGEGWGYTLTGGVHEQSREDVDGDGWSDVAGHRRAVLRPRLHWNGSPGRSLMVVAGGMVEERRGGSEPGRLLPDGTSHREALDTRRLDGGVLGRWLLRNGVLLAGRASAVGLEHQRGLGSLDERDRSSTLAAEATATGSAGDHTWAAGLATDRERFTVPSRTDLSYLRKTRAFFAQDELAAARWLTVSGGGRLEFRGDGGDVSPRLSVLVRPAPAWDVRLSAGQGFARPSYLTEETEATGVTRLLAPSGLRTERARSASVDVGWRAGGWEVDGSAFVDEIHRPLRVTQAAAPGRLEIANGGGSPTVRGAETVARWARAPFQVIGAYTWLGQSETRTPRHRGELAAIVENERRGRMGLELSYTGRQRLDGDPYRTTGRPYFELSALAAVKLGEVQVFLNAVNLTDARQTRYEPLLLPAQDGVGRWTTEAWAPLEGRVVSVGVRAELG